MSFFQLSLPSDQLLLLFFLSPLELSQMLHQMLMAGDLFLSLCLHQLAVLRSTQLNVFYVFCLTVTLTHPEFVASVQ